MKPIPILAAKSNWKGHDQKQFENKVQNEKFKFI